MKLKVVCIIDFTLSLYSGKKIFTRGQVCEYYYDRPDALCDEQVFHVIDGYIVSWNQFITNFIPLSEWRDEQINTLTQK
jgi:hypothetical protein